MIARRWTVPLTCLAVALTMLPGSAPAASRPSPPAGPAAGGASYRLTLVTGDRVRVTTRPGRSDQVQFLPTRASRSDSAQITRAGGHTFVVPSAAATGVRTGRLDRSLFDVTALIAQRYDDRRRATLPVIVEYAGGAAAARSARVTGAAGSRLLASIGSRAVAVRKSAASTFWNALPATVERVSLDDRVTVALDRSVPQIGVPAGWQRGLTGRGVKIAILDTGVDGTHPDLAGRVESANFSEAPDAGDHDGHGTHVASIAAGNGSASGGKSKGVAPEATVLSGKVLDDTGSGTESGIIAGMEWAAAQGAAVANLSLGSPAAGDGTDPMSQALNRLSRETGTLFVVAAGNSGPAARTVSSPGGADDALTVGSNERDGSISDFSSRGPRYGDGALKPELTAPGAGILAARATGTSAGEPVDDRHTVLSGTSMATPHVTGMAALLAQSRPSWTAAQLKARLVSSADPQPGSTVPEQGAGRVDADQATNGGVSVDSAELEFGILHWPFPADDAVEKTLTYSNPTAAPVTLRLTAELQPADAAPELSATELTVPAGGQASVTVTADRAAAGAGMYSGRITATPAAGDPLVTTFGWYAEPESYNLTVVGIERDGRPADDGLVLSRPDGGPLPDDAAPVLTDGKVVVRVPAGEYDVASIFDQPETDSALAEHTTVAAPDVRVDKDTTAVLDARRAKPVDLSVRERPGLNARERSMTYLRTDEAGTQVGGVGLSVTGVPRRFFAVPSAEPAVGGAEFSAGARLEEWPYRARVTGGPALPVADFYFGPRFTGTRTLAVADGGSATAADLTDVRGKLAVIRRTEDTGPGEQAHAAQQAGAAAVLFHDPAVPGSNGVFSYWYFNGEEQDVTIPAMRTSRTAATALLDRLRTRRVPVTVTGVGSTRFSYDLLVPWATVPAGAARRLPQSDFAVIDESFGAHRAGTPTSETRQGQTAAGGQTGGWLVPTIPAPFRRTSYVLGNATNWSSVVVSDNGGENMWFSSAEQTFQAGRRTSKRWLTPAANATVPATGVNARAVGRMAGGLNVAFSPFGHGPDVFDGFAFESGEHALSVSRDGEELGSSDLAGLWLDLPPRAGSYRVSLDSTRETAAWRYSTAVRSVWDFRSSGAEDEVMPVLLADLDVPQADLLNRVPTGRPVDITLGLRHQTGSTASAITGATLEISYDGTHWSRLPIRQSGSGSYRATVTHPGSQAGKVPSLRITATDAAGGRLVQEVTRAYGLTG